MPRLRVGVLSEGLSAVVDVVAAGAEKHARAKGRSDITNLALLTGGGVAAAVEFVALHGVDGFAVTFGHDRISAAESAERR